MKKIYLYILVLISLFVTGCNDEMLLDNTGGNNGEGDNMLSLVVDAGDLRTRAIDMTPGASVFLNKVWVGIYVYQVEAGNNTGAVAKERVGGTNLTTELDLKNRLTASGSKFYNVIPIELYQDRHTITTGTPLIVVGVANYEGIKTTDGKPLFEALKDANTWEKFKEIAIDTQNSEFSAQSPLLMGYLSNEETDDTANGYIHTRVDQFENRNRINLYGTATEGNDPSILVKATSTTSLNTTGKLLKLRRLRSKINVDIKTGNNQLSVTNLEYKIVNIPKSAFLAQRRTNTYGSGQYATKEFSPNSADMIDDGYITLEEAEWQKTTNNYSFSFEHFENIHWARTSFPTLGNNSSDDAAQYILENYHRREQQNSDDSFYYLASSAGDWNNNASYMILKISLRDFSTGRNSVIEYTIHEGFCNDADGKTLVDQNGDTYPNNSSKDYSIAAPQRLRDFSCFRNTDYHYNVTINGVQDIVTTVTTTGNPHPTDQHNGSVWEMKYPTYTTENNSGVTVKNNRLETKTGGSATLSPITFDDIPFEDVAFRLVGTFFDDVRMQEIPVDLCYNFAHGDLDGFSGLWPDPVTSVTEYFVTTTTQDADNGGAERVTSAYQAMEDYFKESHPDVEAMMSRITINDDKKTIRAFIKDLYDASSSDGNVPVNKSVSRVNIQGRELYETEDASDGARNHMIGLYLFDIKKARRFVEGTDRVQTDNHDCYYYVINAIEQYPSYLETENYERIYAWYSSSSRRVPSNKGTTQQVNNGNLPSPPNDRVMMFNDNPDIAFRILGYYHGEKSAEGEYDDYYDLCYNFDVKEFTGFNLKMPPTSSTTRSVTKYNLEGEDIPQDLLDGIKIQVGGNGPIYNVKEFINLALQGKLTTPYDYRFVFSDYKKYFYNEDNRDNNIRGIYIFDKKNKFVKPVLYSSNSNTATYLMYAAEQDAIKRNPTQLTRPTNISYSKYIDGREIKYNVIEEYVGTLTIPLLDNYTYNEDYYYEVNIKTTQGTANKDKTCKVEVNGTPSSGDIIFKVPMWMVHRETGAISVQAIPLKEKYSESPRSSTVSTQPLTNPSWDFRTTDWYNIYTNWSRYDTEGKESSEFRYFINTRNTYETTNFAPLLLYAIGTTTNIRGHITTGDYYLYMNNGVSNCHLSAPIYKSCKVKFTAGYSSYSGRGMTVKAGSFTQDNSYTGTKNDFEVKIDIDDNTSQEMMIGPSSGGGSNIYTLSLTD
ncbi:MAG: hypothetical protein J1F38_09655 [Muribaculaceae bacterium]|nr:hypothetical protein [Muribaculaceae bacterium]